MNRLLKTLLFSLCTCALLLNIGCQSKPNKHSHSAKSGGNHSPHSYSKSEPIPIDPNGFLTGHKQFTFGGKRTGEGYFSADGTHFVFQSEREDSNPFYQIYLTDLDTGKTNRVSPGYGKTTCAWVHPSNKKVLFASTHGDPLAKKKMKAELDFRKSGKKKRYSWDYDDTYDIYAATSKGRIIKNLTNIKGYDAEGAYSPDGQWIVFASNRHAYKQKLSAEDKKKLKQDSSLYLDIYIMKYDGSQVKRLTTALGYDGGPFFSPDGKKVVWRHFETNGHIAEIYTMNVDGSDKTQLTKLKTMSWAPFFHPSGDYVVFTTNKHGYKNFELYIVDAKGKKDPVRLSYMEDFDGLPVFTPDGQHLTWTRRSQGMSQIFKTAWDDNKARKLLGLTPSPIKTYELSHKIQEYDIKRTVTYLASAALNGRKAGSKEETIYSENIEELFKSYGLTPGFKGSYSHKFNFSSGAEMGRNNKLISSDKNLTLELSKNWTPLALSKSGTFANTPVAFAGYGLATPETNKFKAYNSYKDLDVKGKWVMVFRYVPEDVAPELRSHYNRYSMLQHKVMVARERGAKGLIVVSGPNSKVKNDIIKFNHNENTSELAIPVISVSDKIAQTWLNKIDRNLGKIQTKLDNGKFVPAFNIDKLQVSASINIRHKKSSGRNTLAFLKVPGAKNTIVIGAHGDHLGNGKVHSSLMNSTDTTSIHYGADDNASGVAAVIELAHHYSYLKKTGKLKLKQNILFAIWSAEEIGVLGSKAFLEDYKKTMKKTYPLLSSYLNMDMIGRYNDALSIQGVSSSKRWPILLESLIQQNNSLNVTLSDDPYVPTDGMPFYLFGVPSLTFFTGAHTDYHSPRDTADKLNYTKLSEITKFISQVTDTIASTKKPVPFTKVKRVHSRGRRGFRIYLGTIPDYASGKAKGLKLSGVIKGGPAEVAGLKTGDIIIELSGKKIENIHDYVYSLESLRPDKKTKVIVMRQGEKQELNITPKAKE